MVCDVELFTVTKNRLFAIQNIKIFIIINYQSKESIQKYHLRFFKDQTCHLSTTMLVNCFTIGKGCSIVTSGTAINHLHPQLMQKWMISHV